MAIRIPPPPEGREYLLKRRFPNARFVLEGTLYMAKGLSDEQKADLEQKVNAYSDELVKLSDEEVKRLELREREKEAVANILARENREKQQYFNQPYAMADYDYWCKMAYWSQEEVVALLLGRDPRVVSWPRVSKFISESEFANRYDQLQKLVQRAGRAGLFGGNPDAIIPFKLLTWARNVGLEAPAALVQKIESQVGEIPTREKFDQMAETAKQLGLALIELKREHEKLKSTAWEGFDPDSPMYPIELDVAMQAWRAVTMKRDESVTPKEQILKWLDQNYPKHSTQGKQRIAIVCNWERDGGRRKRSES